MGFENAIDKVLYNNLSPNTQDDLYAVPTNTKTRVSSIVVSNVNPATKYFTLHHVPAGWALSDATVIGSKMRKLDGTSGTYGGQSYCYEVPFPMMPGDKISMVSETANTMKVKIVGLEEAM